VGLSGILTFTGNSAYTAASIFKTAGGGINIAAGSGTIADFYLGSSGGADIMYVPHGTTDMFFAGHLLIGSVTDDFSGVVQSTGTTARYSFSSNAPNSSGTYFHMVFFDAGTTHGSITSNGTTTTYGTSSAEFLPDGRRNKNSIKPMCPKMAREVLRALAPSSYVHAANNSEGHGFVVEHVHKNLKRVGVDAEKLGFLLLPTKPTRALPNGAKGTMDYGKWTPFLAAVANDHDDKIAAMEARLAKLERKAA
jgi:hypothetical protein